LYFAAGTGDTAAEEGLEMLSAKKVERVKTKGRYADGTVRGLCLQVSSNGAKSWVLRYEIGGKKRWMGLGGASVFSLKEARDRARLARQKISDKIDPLEVRRGERVKQAQAAAQALTFRAAAERYFDQHQVKWTNAKHREQWAHTLAQYAHPLIGNLNVAEIGTPQVLMVLEQDVPASKGNPAGQFWMVRTTTATRVRNRIELVLDWAAVRGHRPPEIPNPARWTGHLSEVLPEPSKVARVVHHRAVPYVEIPGLMVELQKREGVAARALMFAILTASRSAEALGAAWAEIKDGTWVVPAARMKSRREHRVPLAAPVLELLKDLHTEDDNPHLFIGPKTGAPLSEFSLIEVLRRLGRKETVHGFRSSFSDWAHERTDHANHEIEISLAHSVGTGQEKAYRHGDMLGKRRKLMDAWARFCTNPPTQAGAEVVTLRGPGHG
jgi:integrase